MSITNTLNAFKKLFSCTPQAPLIQDLFEEGVDTELDIRMDKGCFTLIRSGALY